MNLRYYLIIIYNKIILTKIYQRLRNYLFKHKYDNLPSQYNKILNTIIKNKVKANIPINVAFFIHESSKWKYESIYRLMESNKHFKPYIVVVPFASGVIKGYHVIDKMIEVYHFFKDRNYNVYLPLSSDKKTILKLNGTPYEPDLIFYMNCWHECGKYKQFSYKSNLDKLQAYVPYAWMISNRLIEHFNRDFHNCMWEIFYETPIHVKLAQKTAINHGINAIATGYPLLDIFFNPTYKPKNVWKPQNKKKKRIIWAPHHHILEKNKCSNFLFIADMMVQLAQKYQDEIQIAFKPHPELAKKLDTSIIGWNERRRKEYYQKWASMPNTQLEEGEYIDLFLTSDGMIQDCGSFTAEYTCTYKPMLFLIANPNVTKEWNECGIEILKHLYTSDKGRNIEYFIKEVIIEGKDIMLPERQRFVDNYLKPKGNKNATQTIYDILIDKFKLNEIE